AAMGISWRVGEYDAVIGRSLPDFEGVRRGLGGWPLAGRPSPLPAQRAPVFALFRRPEIDAGYRIAPDRLIAAVGARRFRLHVMAAALQFFQDRGRKSVLD